MLNLGRKILSIFIYAIVSVNWSHSSCVLKSAPLQEMHFTTMCAQREARVQRKRRVSERLERVGTQFPVSLAFFPICSTHTHTRSCHSSFDQNASFQVEKELKRLLRADLEADSVRWEIVTADEKKKVS